MTTSTISAASGRLACKDRLQAYLREHGVCFTLRHHPQAFTAQEVAASEHISGKQLAKPVIVEADGRMLMLVLPASHLVQLGKLAPALGATRVHLVTEDDLSRIFDDCEVGAIPPFGNLYGLEVYVDRTLADDERIEFRAGTHTETLGIAYTDFSRLVEPKLIDVARHR